MSLALKWKLSIGFLLTRCVSINPENPYYLIWVPLIPIPIPARTRILMISCLLKLICKKGDYVISRLVSVISHPIQLMSKSHTHTQLQLDGLRLEFGKWEIQEIGSGSGREAVGIWIGFVASTRACDLGLVREHLNELHSASSLHDLSASSPQVSLLCSSVVVNEPG